MASLDKFRAVDIRLDKANEYYIETQFVKEGDYNGRDLVVQITNAGEVTNQTGVTLNLGWRHEIVGNKGLDPFDVIDASQGIFKISYPTELLNAGTVVAVIQVVEDTKITLTRNFKITVEKSPIDESAVVSENSFTVLQDALLTVNQYDNRIANVENTKVDKSTFEQSTNNLTAQLQQTAEAVNGLKTGLGETFSTLTELQAIYPSGDTLDHVVAENGHRYFWDGTIWKDGGVWNAVAIPDIFQKYELNDVSGNPLQLHDVVKGSRFKRLLLTGTAAATSLMVAGKNLLPNPKGDLVQNATVIATIPSGFHIRGNNTTATGFSTTRGQVYFENLPVGTYQLSFDVQLVTAFSSEMMRVISNNLTTNNDFAISTTKTKITFTVTVGSDKRLIFRLNSNEIIVSNLMLSLDTDTAYEPYEGVIYSVTPDVSRVDIVGNKTVIADAGTLTITYNVDANYHIKRLLAAAPEDDIPGPVSESGVYLHKLADLDVIAGDTFEIFENGLINYTNLPEPYQLEINSEAKAIFKHRSNGRFLFDTAGITTDTRIHSAFYLRDRQNVIVGSAPYWINIVTPPSNPATPKNILFVGDSLTANGYYPLEFKRRLTEEFGLTNYNLVGRRLIMGMQLEATGGYHWIDYTSPTSELVSPHVNGFWNDALGRNDFQKYMTDYCGGVSLDVVIITLGTNDHAKGERNLAALRTRIEGFLNRLHIDYPNAKVVLVGQHKAPSVIFEEGNNYWLDRDIWMNALSELYKDIAIHPSFSPFVRFVDTQVLFDNNGGAQVVEEQVGRHSIPNTELRVLDYVHPSEAGYKYYADAALGGFFAVQ